MNRPETPVINTLQAWRTYALDNSKYANYLESAVGGYIEEYSRIFNELKALKLKLAKLRDTDWIEVGRKQVGDNPARLNTDINKAIAYNLMQEELKK